MSSLLAKLKSGSGSSSGSKSSASSSATRSALAAFGGSSGSGGSDRRDSRRSRSGSRSRSRSPSEHYSDAEFDSPAARKKSDSRKKSSAERPRSRDGDRRAHDRRDRSRGRSHSRSRSRSPSGSRSRSPSRRTIAAPPVKAGAGIHIMSTHAEAKLQARLQQRALSDKKRKQQQVAEAARAARERAVSAKKRQSMTSTITAPAAATATTARPRSAHPSSSALASTAGVSRAASTTVAAPTVALKSTNITAPAFTHPVPTVHALPAAPVCNNAACRQELQLAYHTIAAQQSANALLQQHVSDLRNELATMKKQLTLYRLHGSPLTQWTAEDDATVTGESNNPLLNPNNIGKAFGARAKSSTTRAASTWSTLTGGHDRDSESKQSSSTYAYDRDRSATQRMQTRDRMREEAGLAPASSSPSATNNRPASLLVSASSAAGGHRDDGNEPRFVPPMSATLSRLARPFGGAGSERLDLNLKESGSREKLFSPPAAAGAAASSAAVMRASDSHRAADAGQRQPTSGSLRAPSYLQSSASIDSTRAGEEDEDGDIVNALNRPIQVRRGDTLDRHDSASIHSATNTQSFSVNVI